MSTNIFFKVQQLSNKCRFSHLQLQRLRLSGFGQSNRGSSGRFFRPQQPKNDRTNIADSKFRILWKPFCFTVAFSGATFVGTSIWSYERYRSHQVELRRMQQLPYWNKDNAPKVGFRKDVEKFWNTLSTHEKLFVVICGINLLVYIAWQKPSLNAFMTRYFTSHPTSKSLLPMFLSTFSHNSLLHLGFNMFALHSFMQLTVHSLGIEQFTALYLTGGVTSNFTSYLYKVMFSKSPVGSLGASGAILAVIGYACMVYPNIKLQLIFLPGVSFSALDGLRGLMALDFVGCLLRWRFIDHAAHLGAALYGIFWSYYGKEYVWDKRGPVLVYWHKFRSFVTQVNNFSTRSK